MAGNLYMGVSSDGSIISYYGEDSNEVGYTITSTSGQRINDPPFTMSNRNIVFGAGKTHPIWYLDNDIGIQITNSDGSFITGMNVFNAPSSGTTGIFLFATGTTSITYTITLNKNGGLANKTKQVTTSQTSQTFIFQNADKTTWGGHNLLGWASSSSATVPEYKVGDTITLTSASPTLTLYCVWEVVPTYNYTLTLRGNGGTPDINTIESGSVTTTTWSHKLLIDDEPEYEGYEFAGWSASSSATLPTYYTGDTIYLSSPDPSFTLYAIWEALPPTYTYTLLLDKNGGSQDITRTHSTTATSYEYTLTSNDVTTKSGSIFLGWSTESTSSIAPWNVGSKVSFSSSRTSRTLYAIWQEIPQVSKFYWDGVDGTTDNTLIATGTNVSNITYARWNDLQLKLKALDNNYITQTVSAGQTITASIINHTLAGLRTIITAHSLSIVIPNDVTTGGQIYASLFNGIVSNIYSIKDALNYVVDNL